MTPFYFGISELKKVFIDQNLKNFQICLFLVSFYNALYLLWFKILSEGIYEHFSIHHCPSKFCDIRLKKFIDFFTRINKFKIPKNKTCLVVNNYFIGLLFFIFNSKQWIFICNVILSSLLKSFLWEKIKSWLLILLSSKFLQYSLTVVFSHSF